MDYYVAESIRQTQRVFPMQGRADFFRYDMNENIDGLPEDFVAEVLREVTPAFLATYPEPDRFLRKYAAFLGVQYENVLASNGSDMAIRYLLETFGEPGKEVVTVSPTFEMYRVNCSILGLRHRPVAYTPALTMDAGRICEAITGDTRVVVLLHPNSPVGNIYTEDDLESVASCARRAGAVVILDEAYHYFYPHSFLKRALEWDNVVVLRTFSKLFALAACRLGVMIGHPKLISYVRNGKLTFDVNSLALLFGERILDHPELIEAMVQAEAEGRRYTLQVLREKGYTCIDGRGNYILVQTRHDAQEVAEGLERERRVLVHPYGSPPLRAYIRVSTGSKRAMEPFLQAFLDIDGQ